MVFFDMDSTLVDMEIIDETARGAGGRAHHRGQAGCPSLDPGFPL